MARDDALAILRDRRPRFATGLTWVSAPVLRALTWDRGVEHEGDMLETVVRALGCDLAFVDASETWAAEAARQLREVGVAVAWAAAGVLGRIATERGLADVLRASAVDPGSLAFPLDRALHDVLDAVRRGVEAGADVIVVADDLAGASGWLASPDYAMEALVPCYAHAATVAVEGGALPVFHSDGDVRALFGPLARAGYVGVHLGGTGRDGLEAAVPAAGRVGLALLGGVQVAALAHEGARHMGERLASLARVCPLIICDDGGVSAPAEVAAIATVLESARHGWEADAR